MFGSECIVWAVPHSLSGEFCSLRAVAFISSMFCIHPDMVPWLQCPVGLCPIQQVSPTFLDLPLELDNLAKLSKGVSMAWRVACKTTTLALIPFTGLSASNQSAGAGAGSSVVVGMDTKHTSGRQS